MIGQINFNDEVIQNIFGHEAAEDETIERLREYYLKSSVYDQVTANLPLRILVGHKGVGKSALFQVAMADDLDEHRLTLVVQPDDIAGMAENSQDFLATVRAWKQGLTQLLAAKALEGLGLAHDTVLQKALRVGVKLTDFIVGTIDDVKYANLDPTKHLITDAFLRTRQISVYIDDLDRGWQGRKQDITRISALLNAVRDLSNENRNVRFRIALRTDVYYLVRTSDESTDKIEGSVVWQRWTQQEILALLALRIDTYLGKSVDRASYLERSVGHLSGSLDALFEPRFSGRGKWTGAPTHRVLMSLIRKRPRDLVKLCSLAARNAHENKGRRIMSSNLQAVFENYSQGRLQDTVNEFRSELPQIERLLFGMKPSKKERTAHEGYTYDSTGLVRKIKSITEQGQFKFSSGQLASPKDLAAFLYKIDFVTARREDGPVIDRRYFEESRYLQSQFVEFGYDWEVHPAYRWALQPAEAFKVLDEVSLTSESSW